MKAEPLKNPGDPVPSKPNKLSRDALKPLDAWEFARQLGLIEQTDSLARFTRVCESTDLGSNDHSTQQPVAWSAQGHVDRDGRCSVHIRGGFTALLSCFRCGSSFAQEVAFDRRLRLCKSEQEADQLETDEDEDAVAVTTRVDIRQWIEDEMLLSLPMFPSHADCVDLTGADNESVETDSAEVPDNSEISAGAAPTNVGPERSDTQGSTGSTDSLQDTHRPFVGLGQLLKKQNPTG